jgi:NADPH-dependent 2,4-dienoyl-CoA reductase/sulfur reductase-like enzyme
MSNESFEYVIVGAGMAGAAAVRGIRSQDPEGAIALIGAEPDAPYTRPALSKALWREPGTTTVDTIGLDGPRLPGVDFRPSTTVTALDTAARTVTVDSGATIGYRRLILATGGRPRRSGATPGPRVIHFHDLGDYRALRALADRGARIIVVGAGFVGSELAAVLAATEATVTYVFSRQAVGARQFPSEITDHLDAVFADHGIELIPGSRLESVEDTGSGVHVTLVGGRVLSGDAVVLGLGQEPDTGLAERAGLDVDGGVVVDEHWRTSDPDVFAVGDVAAVPDPIFGRRRIEHEDAAVTGGLTAGRNAAGGRVVDGHVPFFYSDLFEDGYEALGRVDASLDAVIDWKSRSKGAEGSSEAVIYYLDADRVLQGVLMWNVWGDDAHDTKAIAARLLADRSPRTAEDLLGRI